LATCQKAAAFASAYGLRGRKGVLSSAASAPVSPNDSSRARVVQAHRLLQEADALEQVEHADADALQGLHRLLERQRHRALPGEVVQLVRVGLVQGMNHAAEGR
jgi:hypothetical protein